MGVGWLQGGEHSVRHIGVACKVRWREILGGPGHRCRRKLVEQSPSGRRGVPTEGDVCERFRDCAHARDVSAAWPLGRRGRGASLHTMASPGSAGTRRRLGGPSDWPRSRHSGGRRMLLLCEPGMQPAAWAARRQTASSDRPVSDTRGTGSDRSHRHCRRYPRARTRRSAAQSRSSRQNTERTGCPPRERTCCGNAA